ncbi:prenyltransferase and squalene oxidase repeat protein [Aspergillus nomiae NRRL 13137]|uniref:Prenyltransferase and squalene oxidase repeat protein n=1 Tax=Aspergillus nomiae NRRL (strain ATCC 15546 / NRRL 13137 / CBS 260.88 / M93) TaxID=1509407 RepID=A0A0L1J0W7_ASPN3|nr:prenyltransferase and squalene oxidase repeat protein [Aspergillus nomiae NRRL 13137]KNG85063.1 prenyltransferase and squalene oxidase repeat protein [Aspergillus nomiae NRRL 13137]
MATTATMVTTEAGQPLEAQTRTALTKATNYAWEIISQRHWCGELESNRQWLLSQQNADGSWGIAPNFPGDVSTSAEAYLAMRILGMSPDSPELFQAQTFIRAAGGLSKMRMFTRIFFAEFGLVPWTAVPQLPTEFILVPAHFPISIYRLASWARSNVVPLLIIAHHRPLYPLPNGLHQQNPFLDELWLDPATKPLPYGSSDPTDPVSFFFTILDKALSYLGGLRRFPTRGYARRRCIQWILQHQEKTGDWAGIIPPMHTGIKALLLEGYKLHDERIQLGLAAIERFTWADKRGKRLQCCISPVWDTVLMIRALQDTPASLGIKSDPRIADALAWTAENQHRGPEGDWRYNNTWYPDIDDTAAAVLAFLTRDPATARSRLVRDAVLWIVGMQNADGGWAAFDHENNRLFLNKIPFSDMESLCDPSTPDVTGRTIECLGMLRDLLMLPAENPGKGEKYGYSDGESDAAADPQLLKTINSACARAIPYLIRTQEATGAWYGRWAVNYVYGTCLVLCGLQYFKHDPKFAPEIQTMVNRAVKWLKQIQNSDGGWGESVLSYREPGGPGADLPRPRTRHGRWWVF